MNRRRNQISYLHINRLNSFEDGGFVPTINNLTFSLLLVLKERLFENLESLTSTLYVKIPLYSSAEL